MEKQWIVVGLAGVTFLLVWSIVIFQFIHINKPTLNVKEVSTVERSYYKKEIEEMDLDRTIETSTQTENINEKLMVTDLRKIDFSDVNTSEGVSIDVILDRLSIR